MMGLSEKARKGIPLEDVFIMDCHTHMGRHYNFNIPGNSAQGMLAGMDALGIDIACVSAFSSIGPDYRFGNDLVLRAISEYPGRFAGYATVNPNYPHDMINELERCFSNGMRAIKLHPSFHGFPIDHKTNHAVYGFADEKKCPVLIHTWGRGDVEQLNRIAGQYPSANFIIGHSGAEIRAMEDTIRVVNNRDNAFADLAVSLTYEGNVEWFVKEMGSKKILFGSDMPFFDPRPNFGRVAMAEIGEDDKKNILGLNMGKLLKFQEG